MSVMGERGAISSLTKQIHTTSSAAQRATSASLQIAQNRFRRHVRGQTTITMVPGSIEVDGLEMRYGVSSNQRNNPDQRWAINIHGFLAGGSMYDRESERLAESLGWRIINPSLPGFGGSEPLSPTDLSIDSLSRRIEALVQHFGIDRVILIGHSMGAAVGVHYAARNPETVLGILYRDGIATPSWHDRHGILPSMVSMISPDLGAFSDLTASVMLDIPDLFLGRAFSTARSLLPDLRRNVKVLSQTAPLGSLLMTLDQSEDVLSLRDSSIPILALWGCFDRVATKRTAKEFSEFSGAPIQWVPGGHSWMLARPSGQGDVLIHLPLGQQFVIDVELQARQRGAWRPRLRSVG